MSSMKFDIMFFYSAYAEKKMNLGTTMNFVVISIQTTSS